MLLYHVATPDSVPTILRDGIKRTSRGEKGGDNAIMRTDEFLDSLRPELLLESGVSRDNNLYAYLAHGSKVTNIDDGEMMDLAEFIKEADGVVLEVDVDGTRCYVSDLDLYDEVKALVDSDKKSRALARRYWEQLVLLSKYQQGQIKRPEVMVTYDIAPESIRVAG